MLQDLILVFPNDPEFRMYQMAAKAGIMINPQTVSTIFYKHVQPYEEKILHLDESFFLEKDFSELHSKKIDIHTVVNKLKEAWCNLEKENKHIIWRYFKILILLNKKIHTNAISFT
jgi:hypothetical protein